MLRQPPTGRSLVVADVAVVLWTAVWVAVGVYVAHEIRELNQLGTTVVVGSRALDETANALAETEKTVKLVERIPGLGLSVSPRVQRMTRRVRQTAASARASARASEESVDNAAAAVGVAVALGPTVPVIVLYGVFRLLWLRDRRQLVRGGVSRAALVDR
jgi:hypothetical protein